MKIYTEIKIENTIDGRDYADGICCTLRKIKSPYKRKDERDYITIKWEEYLEVSRRED